MATSSKVRPGPDPITVSEVKRICAGSLYAAAAIGLTLQREQGPDGPGLFPRPGAGHVGGVSGPQRGLCTAMQLAALRLREGSPRPEPTAR